MTPPSRVDFDRPPVNEVVCGATFRRIEGFETPHFGLLWGRYAEEFPRTADVRGVLRPSGDPPTVDPMERRVWFLSEDERYLIQVQRDRFHFNWRRLRDDDIYPRFEAVYAAFRRHLDVFARFVEPLGGLDVEQLALTYTNFITMPAAGYGALGHVLRDLPWTPHAVLPEPDTFRWLVEGSAPHGESSRLRVVAQTAMRRDDSGPALRLELTVQGKPTGHEPAILDRWFQDAHDSIVHTFVDITSHEAHKTWQRRA